MALRVDVRAVNLHLSGRSTKKIQLYSNDHCHHRNVFEKTANTEFVPLPKPLAMTVVFHSCFIHPFSGSMSLGVYVK